MSAPTLIDYQWRNYIFTAAGSSDMLGRGSTVPSFNLSRPCTPPYSLWPCSSEQKVDLRIITASVANHHHHRLQKKMTRWLWLCKVAGCAFFQGATVLYWGPDVTQLLVCCSIRRRPSPPPPPLMCLWSPRLWYAALRPKICSFLNATGAIKAVPCCRMINQRQYSLATFTGFVLAANLSCRRPMAISWTTKLMGGWGWELALAQGVCTHTVQWKAGNRVEGGMTRAHT